MSRALFVSDIHIQSANDPKAELFAEFLSACQELRPSHLFLVGDIFDLWIADRKYFRTTYRELIAQIQALKMRGVEIYYFEGNHDLDLKVFWQQELNVKVFEGPAYFDLLGRTVRVEHGDEMDPEDKGYLFLRWLLRTPPVRELGRKLPDPAVRWLGERASGASRDYTSYVKTVSDMEVGEKFKSHVVQAIKEKPFDVLVTGHIHVAQDETLSHDGRNIRAFNLGTWLKEPLVLDMSEADVHLRPLAELIHGK